MMRCTPHGVSALVVVLGVSLGAQQNNEEFARLQYESGMNFLQSHRDVEAMKDLQVVVDSFSASSVADDALLQIARYQLENGHDLDAAQTAIDKLLKDYPDTDSAPMAHVLSGRISFGKARTPAALDAALASYERVPRLFPGNDAVAAAGYFAGEALRIVRRHGEALERYRRVSMEYPRSTWTARAHVSAGYCLVQQHNVTQAFQEFQRARHMLPGSPIADEALDLSSIAYRLYLRNAQPPFEVSSKTIGSDVAAYRGVVGIEFDAQGQLMLGHKAGISIFKTDGSLAQTVSAVEPSAFFVDEQDRIVVARQGTLVTERAEAIAFSAPASDGQMRAVNKIPAALPTEGGERLIANPRGGNVLRALPSGRFVSVFATGNVSRMAQNWVGDVAMIDKSTKSIVIVDRDGKMLSTIAAKGTGYEFATPVDLAFDALDHLYVLDRSRSSVFVFGVDNTLVSTLTRPDKSPGALNRGEAIGVDGAGRLYVFDSRSRRVQVYQ